jgi:hypothetical protein
MADGDRALPLSERPRDWFFVFVFAFFAWSSFYSDAWHALGAIDDTTAIGRANLWYMRAAGDDFFVQHHTFAQLNTGISGFLYGPFYLVLVYAFVRGKEQIRLFALLYAAAMIHGFAEFMTWEYTLGFPPRHPLVFWAFNGPYGLVPLLLIVRMWKPNPFSARAATLSYSPAS